MSSSRILIVALGLALMTTLASASDEAFDEVLDFIENSDYPIIEVPVGSYLPKYMSYSYIAHLLKSDFFLLQKFFQTGLVRYTTTYNKKCKKYSII